MAKLEESEKAVWKLKWREAEERQRRVDLEDTASRALAARLSCCASADPSASRGVAAAATGAWQHPAAVCALPGRSA